MGREGLVAGACIHPCGPSTAGVWRILSDSWTHRSSRRYSFPGYTASLNRIVKVLDFVKSGGPEWTVDRTVFEMWLGAL